MQKFTKLTFLLEYLNLLHNFHARNCYMIFAYEIYFTTKIKGTMTISTTKRSY